jgi:hypothetical protein
MSRTYRNGYHESPSEFQARWQRQSPAELWAADNEAEYENARLCVLAARVQRAWDAEIASNLNTAWALELAEAERTPVRAYDCKVQS